MSTVDYRKAILVADDIKEAIDDQYFGLVCLGCSTATNM